MTKRDRIALRRSICEAIKTYAKEVLIDEALIGEWFDHGRKWTGPEVNEECQLVYAEVQRSLRNFIALLR